ncbi:MAG: hypothetical protein AAGI22_14230 [Planctomycetota bacterium]
MTAPLEDQIRAALDAFARLEVEGARVRENEVVNRFVFECLLPRLEKGLPLHAPGQLGIEVTVPQIEGRGGARKHPDVRKDLVIWSEPGETCWSREDGRPVHWPLAVLEFKVASWKDGPAEARGKLVDGREADLDWLERATVAAGRMLGFSVVVDASRAPWTTDVALVSGGQVRPKWWASAR